MRRTDFITKMAEFLDSFPHGCSNYHICDMLIRYAEKHGMSPLEILPTEDGYLYKNEWDEENDEDEL